MSSDVRPPREISVPSSNRKAVQVNGEADCKTVVNALEAAKETEGANTDAEALVEIAESYTGWSP